MEHCDIEQENMIYSLATDRAITVYWERPELFSQNDYYKIFLNQQLDGITEKTHYKFFELESDEISFGCVERKL